MLLKRKSGVLYAIQSFFRHSKYDIFIGDWGNLKIIDYLKDMGFRVLQILPINPICKISYSPYSGNSAFGFEFAFISVDKMIQDGFIDESQVERIFYEFPKIEDFSKIYYKEAIEFKNKVLDVAFKMNYQKIKKELEDFVNLNPWCYNLCLYSAIKEIQSNKPWYEWDEFYKNYSNEKLEKIFRELKERFYFYVFGQYISWLQYLNFKSYANSNGILILGDIPIYVSYDSVDVWANREIFKIDSDGRPLFVAGVPPDYFSSTGQLWGNPVYDWDKLKEQNFKWWIERMKFSFRIYDWVRIDHFRGLVSFWQIPFGSKNAINGNWQEAKPYEFFNTLLDYFPVLPVIAEDLGIITPDVDKFRDHYFIPSMRVLQFAFSDPSNIHLPHNYTSNIVAYTGTHDNNTTKGWYKNELNNYQFLSEYLQKYDLNEDNVTESLIKLILSSVANLVIIPIQDLLNLDEKHRMNTPGTFGNNWLYRDNLLPSYLSSLIIKFREFNNLYKR